MNRLEFEQLRDLPGKIITEDIEFHLTQDTAPNFTFESVVVQNELNWNIVLNGTYKPKIPSVTFNFVLKGVGPICRFCVNGTFHPGSGRTHKHALGMDDDPRLNLPTAAPIQFGGLSVSQIWQRVCQMSNITHNGVFTEPEEGVIYEN
jgi:hypothetical protein